MLVFLQLFDGVKSDGDQELLAGVSVAIHKGMKADLIGRNETGTRLLLRGLPGSAELDSGEVVQGPHLRIGSLRQYARFEPKESTLNFLLLDSGQAEWKCGEVVHQFEPKGSLSEDPCRCTTTRCRTGTT
jgi:ATPase subunit of ABC transporter with duplicated ATPase domains